MNPSARLWAWLADPGNGEAEYICAVGRSVAEGMPLISPSRETMDQFEPFAKEVGRRSGHSVRLVEFVEVEPSDG
jgi:hypothetical protein